MEYMKKLLRESSVAGDRKECYTDFLIGSAPHYICECECQAGRASSKEREAPDGRGETPVVVEVYIILPHMTSLPY